MSNRSPVVQPGNGSESPVNQQRPFVDPSSPIYNLFTPNGLILILVIAIVIIGIIWLFFFSSSNSRSNSVDYLDQRVVPVSEVVEVLNTG